MEDVAKYCSKVLVMNKSKVFMYDTIQNVFSHTEELSSMGLAVPQVTRIFHALKDRGVDVNPDIFTVEEGKRELLQLLSRHQAEKGGNARA